jgi:hypothetical protein
MSNPQRGDVTFEVPGEKRLYRIRFSWNAAAISEEPAGRSFYDALDDIAAGRLSARVLRAFLWAGLREEHRALTLEEAGAFIGKLGHVEAWRLVRRAIECCFEPAQAAADPTQGTSAPPAGSP